MAEKTIGDMFADMASSSACRRSITTPARDPSPEHRGGAEIGARVLGRRARAPHAAAGNFHRRDAPEPRPDRRIQTGGFAARDCGKQTELARRTFDAVVKNTRDITELVQKSSNDATTIIMNRIRESIAEARAAIETKKT
jgi:hypothetical protein